MVFLKTISCCVKQFRNYNGFKFFENLFGIRKKEEKRSNSENTEHFRKAQRQNYSKIAKVSLKPIS